MRLLAVVGVLLALVAGCGLVHARKLPQVCHSHVSGEFDDTLVSSDLAETVASRVWESLDVGAKAADFQVRLAAAGFDSLEKLVDAYDNAKDPEGWEKTFHDPRAVFGATKTAAEARDTLSAEAETVACQTLAMGIGRDLLERAQLSQEGEPIEFFSQEMARHYISVVVQGQADRLRGLFRKAGVETVGDLRDRSAWQRLEADGLHAMESRALRETVMPPPLLVPLGDDSACYFCTMLMHTAVLAEESVRGGVGSVAGAEATERQADFAALLREEESKAEQQQQQQEQGDAEDDEMPSHMSVACPDAAHVSTAGQCKLVYANLIEYWKAAAELAEDEQQEQQEQQQQQHGADSKIDAMTFGAFAGRARTLSKALGRQVPASSALSSSPHVSVGAVVKELCFELNCCSDVEDPLLEEYDAVLNGLRVSGSDAKLDHMLTAASDAGGLEHLIEAFRDERASRTMKLTDAARLTEEREEKVARQRRARAVEGMRLPFPLCAVDCNELAAIHKRVRNGEADREESAEYCRARYLEGELPASDFNLCLNLDASVAEMEQGARPSAVCPPQCADLRRRLAQGKISLLPAARLTGSKEEAAELQAARHELAEEGGKADFGEYADEYDDEEDQDDEEEQQQQQQQQQQKRSGAGAAGGGGAAAAAGGENKVTGSGDADAKANMLLHTQNSLDGLQQVEVDQMQRSKKKSARKERKLAMEPPASSKTLLEDPGRAEALESELQVLTKQWGFDASADDFAELAKEASSGGLAHRFDVSTAGGRHELRKEVSLVLDSLQPPEGLVSRLKVLRSCGDTHPDVFEVMSSFKLTLAEPEKWRALWCGMEESSSPERGVAVRDLEALNALGKRVLEVGSARSLQEGVEGTNSATLEHLIRTTDAALLDASKLSVMSEGVLAKGLSVGDDKEMWERVGPTLGDVARADAEMIGQLQTRLELVERLLVLARAEARHKTEL